MIRSKITSNSSRHIIIEGHYDMGSCQSGDIDFKITVDTSAKRVEYGYNKNWYYPHGYIPYAGSVKSILLHEHGIDVEGYEIVKS